MGALSADQLGGIADPIIARYVDLNTFALQDIGNKIKQTKGILPVDAYKVQAIFETSTIDASSIESMLALVSNTSNAYIANAFQQVAREQYNFYKPFYNGGMLEFEDNIPLQQQIKAIIDLTQKTGINITNHTAFMVFDKNGALGGNKVPTSISETYSKISDYATQAVAGGFMSYDSAMRSILTNLANSGIRDVATYANGYTRRLDTAVRQNIQWGVKQIYQKVSEQVATETGATGWEISYHANPRPTHVDMGGRQYAIKGPVTINGVTYPPFSDVEPLLNDYNCLHTKDAIFLGISEPNYSSAELARMKAEDAEPINFEGQDITKYEASQKQRQLETAMRHCEDRQIIASSAQNDEMLLREQNRMRQLELKYNQLSRASGLPTKYERTVSNWGAGVNKTKSYKMSTDVDLLNATKGKKHSKEIQERIVKVAKSKNIEILNIKYFDGDIRMLLSQIDVVSKTMKEFGIKDTIQFKFNQFANPMDLAETKGHTIKFDRRYLRDSEITNRILNSNKTLSSSSFEGIGAHECGHIIQIDKKIVNELDIFKKAWYNTYNENITTGEVLPILNDSISYYSASCFDNISNRLPELIPEMLAKDNTNASDLTIEFKKLLKEITQ